MGTTNAVDEAAEQAAARYRDTRTHVFVALSEHCSFPHVGAAADAVTALVQPQLEAVYAAGLRTLAELEQARAELEELRDRRDGDARAVAALLRIGDASFHGQWPRA